MQTMFTHLKKQLLVGTILGSVAGMGLTAPVNSAGEILTIGTSEVEPKYLAVLDNKKDPTSPETIQTMAREINRFLNAGGRRTSLTEQPAKRPYTTYIDSPVAIEAEYERHKMEMDGKSKFIFSKGSSVWNTDILPPTHPIHQVAQEAYELYSAAHPKAPARMPHHILAADSYENMLSSSRLGFMIMDREILKLPKEKQIALFAHEYRHDAQFMAGLAPDYEYSVADNARALGLNLTSNCGVLRTQDLALLLPTDAAHAQLENPQNYDEEIRQNVAIRTQEQFFEHDRFSGLLNVLNAVPQCKSDVRSLHDNAAAAITLTGKHRIAHRQANEHDSDIAARDTIKYAIKTGKLKGSSPAAIVVSAFAAIGSDPTEVADQYDTHPAFKDRLKVLGCRVEKRGNSFAARCEKTAVNTLAR